MYSQINYSLNNLQKEFLKNWKINNEDSIIRSSKLFDQVAKLTVSSSSSIVANFCTVTYSTPTPTTSLFANKYSYSKDYLNKTINETSSQEMSLETTGESVA